MTTYHIVCDGEGGIVSQFSGKLALVTGAAGGIGAACAEALAAEGATVALLDRDMDGMTRVCRTIRSSGGRADPFAVDFASREAVGELFDRLKSELAPIDILVNNVGQSARENMSEFADSKPETWDFVISISLMTTMHCTRQVLETMRARRSGKIINISSDAALRGDAKLVDYSAAKAGVIGFTKALAKEMGPFNVNVNAICPGPTLSAGLAAMPKDVLDTIQSEVPIGFLGQPADIANAVVFCASEKSRYMTGHALVVNGGRGL